MKKLTCYLVIVFSLLVSNNSLYLHSQVFIKSYNLTTESGNAVISSLDGRYVISGIGNTGMNSDDWFWLRLLPSGYIDGSPKYYGLQQQDSCHSMVQSSDSGYVLAGSMKQISDSKQKAVIIKLDRVGAFSWSRMLQSTDINRYLQVTRNATNQNFACVGYIQPGSPNDNRLLVSSYNSSGMHLWTYIYRESQYDLQKLEGRSICYQSSGNSYGVAGDILSFSIPGEGQSIFIANIQSNGVISWFTKYRFGFSGANYDYAKKIIPMSDGGFVVLGITNTIEQGTRQILAFRVSSGGTVVWSNVYYVPFNIQEGESIILSTDGNLVFIGSRGGANLIMVKIPAAGGAPLWAKQLTSSLTGKRGIDITETSIGGSPGYAFCGLDITPNDVLLVRTDLSGGILNSTCIENFTLNFTSRPPSTAIYSFDRDSIDAMNTSLTQQNAGFTSSNLCDPTTIIKNGNLTPVEFKLYQNYPNPFNPVTTIRFAIPSNVKRETSNVKLIIFDILGREIATLVNEQLKPGTYEVDWDGTNFASGIYYYKITAGDYTDTKKMVLIK